MGPVLVVAMLLIPALPGLVLGADATAEATRSVDSQTVGPGGTVEVTVEFTSLLEETASFILQEVVPAGWTITQGEDDATAFDADDNKWFWMMGDDVEAGETKTVTYSLTVPPGTTHDEYSIEGTVLAAGVHNAVGGHTAMTVEGEVPPDGTADPTRSIDPETIAPGGTVQVTVEFESWPDQVELFALVEDIPVGWAFDSIDDGDAAEMRTDAPVVWLWDEAAARAARTVVYTLTAPENAAAAQYTIEGVVKVSGEQDKPVLGDNTVTVEGEPVERYTVSLAADPPGTGELEGGGTYEAGQTVTIQMVAAAHNSSFVNWTSVPGVGFDAPAAPETTFTMPAQDVTVTARFEVEEGTYMVTLVADPPGGGQAAPATGAYYPGEMVEITATANQGYRFVEWTTTPTALREELGDPEARETDFEMRASDVTVTARFEREEGTYMVTVVADPPEGGDVSPASAAYYPGETVGITATENPGYRFVEWTTTPAAVREELADPEARETGFEMRASDVTVTARFEAEAVPPVDDDDGRVNTLAILLALAAGASLLAAAAMFFSRRKLRQSEEGPGPGEPGDDTKA